MTHKHVHVCQRDCKPTCSSARGVAHTLSPTLARVPVRVTLPRALRKASNAGRADVDRAPPPAGLRVLRQNADPPSPQPRADPSPRFVMESWSSSVASRSRKELQPPRILLPTLCSPVALCLADIRPSGFVSRWLLKPTSRLRPICVLSIRSANL